MIAPAFSARIRGVRRLIRGAVALSVGVAAIAAAPLLAARRTQPSLPHTRVVLLGTGTPRPLPQRSGPGTAIVVNDVAYLVDCGPGIVRRAAAAAEKGVTALEPKRLRTVFVTHLHSDHTTGYPDLILAPWVMGRTEPLRVYGPKGIVAMTDHVLQAWKEDIAIRTRGEGGRTPLAVEPHEIDAGVVYQDANVAVTAFRARHGEIREAFGYSFKTRDRTIVISGDTSPNPDLIEACRKCDVLIHEVYASTAMAPMSNWLEYREQHHTSTRQLAEIATTTQPGLLILYHIAQRGPDGTIPEDQYLREIRATYKGKVVIGHDLDIY